MGNAEQAVIGGSGRRENTRAQSPGQDKLTKGHAERLTPHFRHTWLCVTENPRSVCGCLMFCLKPMGEYCLFCSFARSPPPLYWMPFERGPVLGIVPGYGLCRFVETCSLPPQGDMPVAISFWFCSGTHLKQCSINVSTSATGHIHSQYCST